MTYKQSNQTLQFTVQETLRWEPQLQGSQFGVIAENGIVTLTGITDSYFKKIEAEKATKNTAGVRAVIERIAVVLHDNHQLSDEEIAQKIIAIYHSSFTIPEEKIKITVENGWVTLEGNVHWNYQKNAAEEALQPLQGIRGISNLIRTQTSRDSTIKKEYIQKALHHSALLHDTPIEVDVNNRKVTLKGSVNTLYEKEEAERLAWNAKGVVSVDNSLVIGPLLLKSHDHECE